MITKCPKCKTNLKETGIGLVVKSDNEKTYLLSLDKHNDLQYKVDYDYGDDQQEETFYCRECNQDLDLTEEEVIKILK